MQIDEAGRRRRERREKNSRRILGLFYLTFALLHVFLIIKGYTDPVYKSRHWLMEAGYYYGLAAYLLAALLNSRGYKNAGVWIYFVEMGTHLLVINHFNGLSIQGLAYWYIMPLLIFLSNYALRWKVSFVLLVAAVSTYQIIHGHSFSPVGTGTMNVSLGNTITLNLILMGFIAAIAYLFENQAAVAEQNYEEEHALTTRLLHNILPESIADKLKSEQQTIVRRYDDVTVMFIDIVGFTELSQKLAPEELVGQLNETFTTMDHLAEKYGLEKIKTIGDAYMVVGGLPEPMDNHGEAIADMALELQASIAGKQAPDGSSLRMRMGINRGAVVAGVIGKKKFSFDLWGDVVNTAARMESHGLPDKIQVTAPVYEALKDEYVFEARGVTPIKGKGEMPVYWLTGRATGG